MRVPSVDIDTNTFVRFWLVVIAFCLLGFLIYASRDALIIVGAALFLALALNYPVKKIANFLPNKSRLVSTTLSFCLLILTIGSIIWFAVPPVVEQSAKVAENVPILIEQASNQWEGLRKYIDDNGFRPQVDSAMKSLHHRTSEWVSNIGNGLISSVGSLMYFLASAVLVVVLAFLMLIEGPSWMNRIWKLYKDKKKRLHHQKIVGKIQNVITGYITGQLIISGIGAVAAGSFVFVLSFFFDSIPNNLAMPTILITFLLSLIPLFGSALAGIIVGILLSFNSVTAAIIYIIYFIIYQQIENNFISPAVQSKRVELSALIILVSVTIGVCVAGLLGGFIAIPVAGSVKVFVDDYLESHGTHLA